MSITLNNIMGDSNYYNNLAYYMNTSDGWGTTRTYKEIKKAQIQVELMINKLRDKTNVKNNNLLSNLLNKLRNKIGGFMEKEVNESYREIIDKLVEKFDESISNDDLDKSNLIKGFEKNIYDTIEDLKDEDSEMITKVVVSMAYDLITKDITYKKQQLLIDEYFEEIRKISGKVFGLAQDKLQGNEISIDFDIDKSKKKLQDNLKMVASYNKNQAETMVSEALLDMNYIINKDESILSLRIAHMKNDYLGKNEEER